MDRYIKAHPEILERQRQYLIGRLNKIDEKMRSLLPNAQAQTPPP